jgi:hypothetical protein
MSITLASIPAAAAAIARARSVSLTAYTLRDGAIRDALITAARSGADVRVRLERDPLDDGTGSLHAANDETVARLRAAGADAALTGPGEPVLHMKAAVVDGVAWLDDRNWAGDGPETLVRDADADDVAAVAAGIAGKNGSDGHLGTTKSRSQVLEADLIRAAGSAPLALESESFGSGQIYNALLHRAEAGLPTRLLVAGREAQEPGTHGDTERKRLARLQSLGVDVRTGNPRGLDYDEKLAVAGGRAWVGSTNATYARGAAGAQRDWGLATREPSLVDGLTREFERNWHAAATFDGSVSAAGRVPVERHRRVGDDR